MPYQKLQASRATEVATITSNSENTLNLNNPIALTGSGVTTAGTVSPIIIVATATFITDGVTAGDLLVNTTTSPNASRVISVDSETQLTIQSAVTVAVGNVISIWTQSKEAAVIYVGTQTGTQTIKVTTAGGDDVTFTSPVQGRVLPVQCVRVWTTGTTATNVVALW